MGYDRPTGSILDIPASPSGEEYATNYPYGLHGIPTITDTTYVVTESGLKYYIDGVQQAAVELQLVYTYRFDTSTFGGTHLDFQQHPMVHMVVVVNIQGVSVGGRVCRYNSASSTPSTLCYYCTIHGGMGGQINVVDNSEFKVLYRKWWFSI